MYTYQDFVAAADKPAFIAQAINEHRRSAEYDMAYIAEQYDAQQNVTINKAVREIYSGTGQPIVDPTASNNRIASNFFHRLLTQRVSYSLGNGVTFAKHHRTETQNGESVSVDETKEKLGDNFDTRLYQVCYSGEMAGSSYAYLNYDSADKYSIHLFPFTEFVPMLDEDDGSLRAGIRYWSLDWSKRPIIAVLYEEDGFTKYRSPTNSMQFEVVEPKRGYKQIVRITDVGGEKVVGEENYSAGLPIVPFYGKGKRSALTGMRAAIDAHDLISSGWCNDLTDVAQIYWLIGNAVGMDDNDLKKFRERLIYQHIGIADLENSSVTPYTQEVPYQARAEFLQQIRGGIYESFGALDVLSISAGAKTATEIEAAYQPMDEEADDFEYRVIEFVMRLLKLIGVDDMPLFKRNRVSNQAEQVNMIVSEAAWLDDETVLDLFPNVTPDMKAKIMERKAAEDAKRLEDGEELDQRIRDAMRDMQPEEA